MPDPERIARFCISRMKATGKGNLLAMFRGIDVYKQKKTKEVDLTFSSSQVKKIKQKRLTVGEVTRKLSEGSDRF